MGLRGDERIQDEMFSCVTIGAAGSGGSPFTGDSRLDGRGAGVVELGVRCAVRGFGAAVDCAGVCAAGTVVAGFLFAAFGAAIGQATGLQPAVPLVRGAEHG